MAWKSKKVKKKNWELELRAEKSEFLWLSKTKILQAEVLSKFYGNSITNFDVNFIVNFIIDIKMNFAEKIDCTCKLSLQFFQYVLKIISAVVIWKKNPFKKWVQEY